MRHALHLKLTEAEVKLLGEFKVNKVFSSDLVLFFPIISSVYLPLCIPFNPKWELLICQKGNTFEQLLSQPEARSTKGLVLLVWEFGYLRKPSSFWVLTHSERNSCIWGHLAAVTTFS